MKLAEALIEKKGLLASINGKVARFAEAVVVDEGTKPEENGTDILYKLESVFDDIESLTTRINKTNNVVKVGDRTMMEAISHRDSLKIQIAQYNAIAATLKSKGREDYYGNESAPKKVLVGYSVIGFVKIVDGLSKELRELDLAIQSANWTNDLVE